MGEQVNKEEPKHDEKVEPKKAEEKENKSEEKSVTPPPPPPPPPFVLYIDLHCVGCAKKIEKILTSMRGIEGVVIDMANNQVTLKGLVEPQVICNRIMKKTKRMAKVVSPLPEVVGEPIPPVVASQATEPITVELDVNMHCQACADQLKKKILKMKGVQNVETQLSSSKVTVTGTMDPNSLVEYVYRRTKKQAKIVPQPEPEPAPAEEKKEAVDEQKAKEENPDGKKSVEPTEKGKKEEDAKTEKIVTNEGMEHYQFSSLEEEVEMKKIYYFYPPQQPLYVVERLPPAPQMFSDENPNACSIC
ncbi:unnamed protein product [Rhodiola kirilowii]